MFEELDDLEEESPEDALEKRAVEHTVRILFGEIDHMGKGELQLRYIPKKGTPQAEGEESEGTPPREESDDSWRSY